MAQHDYVIANASGATVRADINNMALAISSNNSGSSAPGTTYAYLWWLDTSANVLKLRNSANNAWITMPFSITANNTVDINGGAIDGTPIGASAASTGAFTTLSTTDNLSIGGSNKELRFYEGTNYVGFEAPALTGDKIWVLPAADGSNGQALTTNGSGTLSWASSGIAGIVSSADATAITINSSEQVGIGTASPAQTLHTSGTGVQRIQVDATDNNAGGAGLFLKVLNSGSIVGQSTVRVNNGGDFSVFCGTSSESEKFKIEASGDMRFGLMNAALTAAEVYTFDNVSKGNCLTIRTGGGAHLFGIDMLNITVVLVSTYNLGQQVVQL